MPTSRRSNLNHFRSWFFNITTAGTAEKLTIKYAGIATISFKNNGLAADTITDTAAGFFPAGLRTGDSITISGAVNAANNNTFVIYDISADGTTITLSTAGTLTTESAGNSVTILSPVTVPEGVVLTVKAHKLNTGIIYIGAGKLNAQGHKCFTLASNEPVLLQVVRSDVIWLDAQTSGEGVECVVEQNKQGQE